MNLHQVKAFADAGYMVTVGKSRDGGYLITIVKEGSVIAQVIVDDLLNLDAAEEALAFCLIGEARKVNAGNLEEGFAKVAESLDPSHPLFKGRDDKPRNRCGKCGKRDGHNALSCGKKRRVKG